MESLIVLDYLDEKTSIIFLLLFITYLFYILILLLFIFIKLINFISEREHYNL